MTTTPKKKSTPRTVRYGYKLDGRTGAVTKDADQQLIIDRIVLEHWDGFSFAMIASGLTADGIKAPGGGDKWHGSSVERVWDRVTNGQMKRIEKAADAAKKAEQEAYHASEAGQMAPVRDEKNGSGVNINPPPYTQSADRG